MVVRPPRQADFYFTVPAFQFRALRESFELIERELPELIRRRGLPGWDGNPAASGEAVKAQLYQSMVDRMMPQAYRGAFLVALWGLYESTVIMVGNTIRRLAPQIPPVPTSHGWLRIANRHYKKEVGFPLFPPAPPKLEDELWGLQRVRNVFMHANGLKQVAKKGDWSLLEDYARKNGGVKLSNGYLEVTADFVRTRFDVTAIALRHLIDRGRDKLENLGLTSEGLPDEPPDPQRGSWLVNWVNRWLRRKT